MALEEGRGAWTTIGKPNGQKVYVYSSMATRDGLNADQDLSHLAVNYGVKAIQRRLNYLGFRYWGVSKIPVNGLFGPVTRHCLKRFQKENGLSSDGVFGPKTAAVFWKPLVRQVSARVNNVRPDILWGQMQLESAGDPGAVSRKYDPAKGPDLGLCQINLYYNPEVSIDEAFYPGFAVEWSARKVKQAYNEFAGKGRQLREDCTIAQHNSPQKADQWFETGSPPDEQIANYVRLVKERMETY